MLRTDRYALECDLAETYRVYNWRDFPVAQIATFASGLRETSRIKSKISGRTSGLDLYLMAGILDALNILIWFQTEDGQKGVKRPKSLSDMFLLKARNKKRNITKEDIEEYEKERERVIKKIKEGKNG